MGRQVDPLSTRHEGQADDLVVVLAVVVVGVSVTTAGGHMAMRRRAAPMVVRMPVVRMPVVIVPMVIVPMVIVRLAGLLRARALCRGMLALVTAQRHDDDAMAVGLARDQRHLDGNQGEDAEEGREDRHRGQPTRSAANGVKSVSGSERPAMRVRS